MFEYSGPFSESKGEANFRKPIPTGMLIYVCLRMKALEP